METIINSLINKNWSKRNIIQSKANLKINKSDIEINRAEYEHEQHGKDSKKETNASFDDLKKQAFKKLKILK
jgi:hypothetical protein